MRKSVIAFMFRYRPWVLISYLCKIPLVTNLVQHVYHKYFLWPKSVKIHLSDKCNYDCTYCYSKSFGEGMIKTSDWLKIIDRLTCYNLKTLEISGGEPFLYKDLLKIIKKASANKLQITVYTNGSLISKDWVKKIMSLGTKVIISIKYDAEETYFNTRSRYTLEHIEKNIGLLVKNSIPVVAFITVTKQNIRHIKKVLNKAVDLGAFPVLERYIPVRSRKVNNKLSLDNKRWFYALSLIKQVYSNYKQLIDGINRIQGGSCSCYATQFSIMQNGDVIPCQFLPPQMKAGNVLKDSLDEIWLSMKDNRAKWLSIPEECKNCQSKLICRGGCRTSTYYKYGNFSRKDPLCCGRIPTTLGHCAFAIIHNFQGKKINNRLLNKIN